MWRPDWPCPVGRILRQQRHGGGDPTYRLDGDQHWRGIRTPDGPATLLIEPRPRDGEVYAEAWGPGAAWALEGVPAMLGADDDPSGFEPLHPLLVEIHRRHPHWRLGRSDRVMEALVPAIVEQKVTGKEAFAGFRDLVHRFGERAPAPAVSARSGSSRRPSGCARSPRGSGCGCTSTRPVPAPSSPSPGWATRIDRIPAAEADKRLRTLPGVGIWTSAEVRQRAFGDADAVSFGDYHVAKDIGWALTGERIDDVQLAELLEPWRPHRGRVQAYVAMAGLGAPRRGPRMALPTHYPS